METTGTMTSRRYADLYLRDAWYEFVRLLRAPAAAIPMLTFPAMFYVLFGVVFAHHAPQQASWVLGSMGAFGVMAPGLFGIGIGVSIERERGLLALKRAMPVPPGAYLGAKLAMALLFALAIFIILGVLAVALGGVRLELSEWLALLATMLLGALPFCALGLLVGTLASAQAAPAVANLIYLPMSFLSGLWIPLKAMPPLLRHLAPIWPAYHLGQLALESVGLVRASTWHAVLALLAFTVACFALATRRLQRVG